MNYSDNRILFLDIGGVLLSNGWGKESRKKGAKQFGLDFDEMNERHNLIFNLYETGKITLDEYLETVVFNYPRKFSIAEFKDFMFAQSRQLPGLLPWLIDWKKKSRVKIISIHNEGRELNDHRVKKFGLTNCFDAFISSCDTGMCKPNRELYELALAVVRRPAGACVYCDDTLVHVEAARKTGIQAFHHHSFEATKKILKAMSSQEKLAIATSY
jgi:putative hydrolase of the HAD superfamily